MWQSIICARNLFVAHKKLKTWVCAQKEFSNNKWLYTLVKLSNIINGVLMVFLWWDGPHRQYPDPPGLSAAWDRENIINGVLVVFLWWDGPHRQYPNPPGLSAAWDREKKHDDDDADLASVLWIRIRLDPELFPGFIICSGSGSGKNQRADKLKFYL